MHTPSLFPSTVLQSSQGHSDGRWRSRTGGSRTGGSRTIRATVHLIATPNPGVYPDDGPFPDGGRGYSARNQCGVVVEVVSVRSIAWFRSLIPADGFANTGLVFRSRRLGGHVSHNDMTRTSGLPFMANYIKIRTREEKITGDANLTIQGNPILLTHGLDGSARQYSARFCFASRSSHLLRLETAGSVVFGFDAFWRWQWWISIFRRLFRVPLTGQHHQSRQIRGNGRRCQPFFGQDWVDFGNASHRTPGGTRRHSAALGEATVLVRRGAKLVSSVHLDAETLNRIGGDGSIVIPD